MRGRAHLLPLVAALERGGKEALGTGFKATPGGYECVMTRPLDFSILRAVLGADDDDVHLSDSGDLVWCSHCWASIIGPLRVAEAEADS